MSHYQPPTEGDYLLRLSQLNAQNRQPWEIEQMFRIAHLGDTFAAKNDWPVQGLDGVTKELIRRHGWTPPQIEELSPEQLRIVLAEDLVAATLTAPALSLLAQWIRQHG